MAGELSNFELPIRFPLLPSKWVIAVVYAEHIGALAGLYFSGVALLWMLIVGLVIALSLAYCHYKMVYLLNKNPTELLLNDRDEWYAIGKDGEQIPMVLLPEAFVHTHLLVLVFKQAGSKRIAILTPDNISKILCRRLRVRLKFSLS